MTSTVFVFYLTSLFLWKKAQMTDLKSPSSFHQQSGFVSVNVGDTVTLSCFYKGDVATRLYWYKQTVGQKPRLISTFFKYNVNHTFHDEFNNNPRFALDTKNGKNDLTIKTVNISDSATYYCLSTYSYNTDFIETTTVIVKCPGLSVPALVHQSVSESIQPGGSVTLNCTVHTGTCDGEHSVYWFKDSGESHPGIIYTHGDRNDQCERKTDTQTHTCVYNLQMKNFTLSHVGTYYCAIVSCGHILFGNRNKLVLDGLSADNVVSVVWMYFLIGALTFTTILVVLLIFLLCKTNSCQSTEQQASMPALSITNSEIYQENNLNYAALRTNLPNSSRRQKNDTESECVYSSVQQ